MAVLLASQDPASAETMEAMATLKRFGKAAIPKLIAAFDKVRKPQPLVALLTPLVQNATLPLFGDGLASTNPRVAAGVVDVLAQATTYDANRLLDFFTDPRISKATLGKLLASRQEALDPKLLLRCLDTVRPEDQALLLKLLHQVATVELVPELIRRITRMDEAVRLAMLRTLTRFHTVEVREALMGLLTDPHGRVRQAALEGLRGLALPLEVGPICQLLRDPERAIRRQASALLTQLKEPQAVPYLFDILQDPVPEVQQDAMELLSVVGDPGTLKAVVATHRDPAALRDTLMGLLFASSASVRRLALEGLAHLQMPPDVVPIGQLLWDVDRTVRRQAAVLLSQLNNPHMLPVLLEALQDEASDVRQWPVAILNTVGDTPVIKALLEALRNKDWWVTMRITDALGRHGGPKVVEAALQLLMDEDAFLRRSAAEILKLTQEPGVLSYLVNVLDDGTLWGKTCAAEALAALGEKGAVPALLRLARTGTPDENQVALRALTTLVDARAIPAFLARLQDEDKAVREEALQALAVLTDAVHAPEVLQAVMAVRDTVDADLKDVANGTAIVLIRKFGDRALGRPAPAVHPSMPMPQRQPLLHDTREPGSSGPPLPETEALSAMVDEPHTERFVDAMTLQPGALLASRYRVIRHVGKGGFGTVVLVEDTVVHEEIILKFLNRDVASNTKIVQRFIHELRYARRITHENVIRIHEFLMLGTLPAIAMEYFPSRSLYDDLKRSPMNMQRALKIVWDVCSGMSAAHQVGVVHRDLKPPNILINDADLVKIVDFGLAAVNNDDSRLTKTGGLLGTPTYMAPEQVQARTIDTRTDIYSLGVILYEIFTGRPPYVGKNPMAVLYQHVEGKPTPPRQLKPDLPADLEAVILKAMRVDPAERFQTMDDLRRSIGVLLQQAGR